MEGGLELRVRAQPRARREGLQGLAAGTDGLRLRIAVNAPPEDGRANRALCALLAAALSIPASRITVTRGATSREKTLRLEGDATALAGLLSTLT